MTDTGAPEQKAGNEEQAGNERCQKIKQAVAPTCQIEERIILYQSQRDDIGEKLQNSLSIYSERIRAKFPSAVCENINKFQSLRRKKAQRGMDDKQTGKNCDPWENHENQQHDIVCRPSDPAGWNGIAKYTYGLNQTPQPRELDLWAQYL